MENITLDLSKIKYESNTSSNQLLGFTSRIKSYFKKQVDDNIKSKAIEAKKTLVAKTGAGSDYLGWIDLPVTYNTDEFNRVIEAADRIRENSDVLVVIGIGGSYLGAKAADAFLNGVINSAKGTKGNPDIYYAGNSISTKYLDEIVQAIGDRDFSVNVISKSGTTTEPAIAFRFFKKLLEDKYGTEGAKSRIYATTDKSRGALKTMSDTNGYETFVVPDDIGGRFSVLSPVGLLPIAVAGGDITELLRGASDMRKLCLDTPYDNNDAMKYASVRYMEYISGKHVEILANYEPSLHYVAEWWKQLFGESEGKNGKGIFPAAVDLTTDLHSMGQYIQDGKRVIFETVLNIESSDIELVIDKEDSDLDGLNYLAGTTLEHVNKCAMKGTILAHSDGHVPVMVINIPKQNEYYLGQLFYFFEFAVGISGYMLKVNPFDQPGVESYKNNMFALLGKPGHEKDRDKLLKRLEENI